MASLRSSTRVTPRKRYTVDAFESIQDLLVESGSSSAGKRDQEDSDESKTDDEPFEAAAEPSDADDDSMSGLDDLGPLEEVDQGASENGELDLDDDISIVDEENAARPRMKSKTLKKPLLAPEGHQLFLPDVYEGESKNSYSSNRRTAILGPTADDWEPVRRASERWKHEPCLPSRITSNDRGGFEYSASYQQHIIAADSNWKWYEADGGGTALQERQVLRQIAPAEADGYAAVDGTGERSFVVGPIMGQQLFTMKPRQYLVLSDPYRMDHSEPKSHICNAPNYRSGFIMNLGARVQCLDWAPSQPGPKQYLAASLLPKRPNDQATRTSAFSPQQPLKSHIQIWEFSSTVENYIDKNTPPRICLTICTAAGDIKVMKWCSIPRTEPHGLGLLACIFGDGTLRIFDIGVPGSIAKRSLLLLERAAFEVRPPNTVCTSVAWLSSSRIAASCANGYVAVWDLSKAEIPNKANPRPEIYTSISTGYIVSITSCFPSFPNMIAATTMSGYVTLTDLTTPNPGNASGTALSHRVRIGQYHVVWHDKSHAAITVEENMYTRALPLRRWFHTLCVGRVNSQATAMATSPCHPFVLIGCANGEAVGTNPTKKIASLSRPRKRSAQQTWFLHEWRRATDAETTAAREGESNVQATIGRAGLSRFVDGFKAVEIQLGRGTQQVRSGSNSREFVPFAGVYEEKSAVTALAWNPNIHVAGWAAAGMGDGLLRVEDIAS